MKFFRSARNHQNHFDRKIFSFLFVLLFSTSVFAVDNERILPLSREQKILDVQGMPYTEVDRRTQLVLRHFGIPAEPSFIDYLSGLNHKQSLEGFNAVLPYFSPDRSILNFLKLDVRQLEAYQDIYSKQRLDFQIPFATAANPASSSLFELVGEVGADAEVSQHAYVEVGQHAYVEVGQRAYVEVGQRADAEMSAETGEGLRPLANLKVAIDPGHMGTDFWDTQTGKFVRDSNGRKLSEGILNLQTAILLKQELEKLGAQVLLTREGLHPVAQVAWDKFDLAPVARNELRESVHSTWFLNLVMANVSDQEMLRSFESSAQVKRLFSENSRSDYFIKRVDLWARTEMMEQFKPDIVLIIHYDVAEAKAPQLRGVVNPKSPRQTKAFVVGGHQRDEIGSRKSRSFMIRHMLDARAYANSIKLSKLILGNLQNDLGLELPSSADEESYLIQRGIFARNLLVPRFLTTPAISYLECLFYDNPSDFAKLSQKENNLIIDGKNYPYSIHLFKIVTAIKNGVLAYSK